MKLLCIVRYPTDEISALEPVGRALEALATALENHRISIRHCESPGQSEPGEACLVVAHSSESAARVLAEASGVSVPDAPGSFALLPGDIDGRKVTVACGSDALGLAYAIRELSDQLACGSEPTTVFAVRKPIVDEPATPIRSITRLFSSDVEDPAWFHDRSFWPRYLSMLVGHRFNRFSLALGLGYNFPRDVHDAYFYFPYPFLFGVPGYEVTVPGLPDEERDRNLESLKFIAAETDAVGLHFQLAIWTHAYEWIDSLHANYVISGLTPENHAAYCRDALKMLLESCPQIKGVTFRIHGESGIPEGEYGFWETVFDGIEATGRRIEIDMHPKGIDDDMIETGLSTGMPVNLSPKYAAEHMGLPYQQASIRDLERLPREARPGGTVGSFMSFSGGSRLFLRYNYGDLLSEDRHYGVLYRIWPGTQRLLLWGDPQMAAGFGRYGTFSGCLGIELFDPLSFKGRMGSGVAGSRDGYADGSLRPAGGSWEKYLYTYRLFGRLQYNPDADPECWRRFLRKTYGTAAEHTEKALANASRILPLVTMAHHPSASNNAYWPEIYTNMPIVSEDRGHPYWDTPSPKRFGAVSPLDPEVFSSIDDFADELLAGRLSGRYSPLDVARWLDRFCGTAEESLREAEGQTADATAPSFRVMAIDVAILIGIGRFFAHKLRSGLWFALFERVGSRAALQRALSAYRSARDAWATLVEREEGVYARDLTFGLTPHLRGHWSDRIAAIDGDIADMVACLSAPRGAATRSSAATPSAEGDAVVSGIDELLARVAEEPLRPSCTHTPPDRFRPGDPVRIEVAVEANGDLAGRLHYRRVNQAEAYEAADMQREGGALIGSIPAGYTDSPYPLQYFVTFHDTGGRACIFPGLEPALSNQPYYLIRRG